MEQYFETIRLLLAFLVILIAANRISYMFLKVKLPLITGLLITGVFAGPFILQLIPKASITHLNFLNEISLAFIAFAAGSELYLKEIRSRMKSIIWMTFGQLVITFVIGVVGVYFIADYIPFMDGMETRSKIAIAVLVATIFVARSPSSAIAVINELRAKGPFTQTAMGVTVLKDVLVIILFAINFSLAGATITGEKFDFFLFLVVLLELAGSFLLGYVLGKVLEIILSIKATTNVKTVLILSVGYGVYVFSSFVSHWSEGQFGVHFHMEPLLICIIGSFVVTNYSKYRPEFLKIIHDTGPYIYLTFFTLTGAGMSMDILMNVWQIALALFAIRLLGMVLGGYVGGILGGDPMKYNRISWMPYVTQAGVGLGLVTEIAGSFPSWGEEFATIIIAVIVLNQIVGPPLFKWSIAHVDEDHSKGSTPLYDGPRDAIIFGLEGKAIALARTLMKNGWQVKIATNMSNIDLSQMKDVDIHFVKDWSVETLDKLETEKAEAIVTMLSDKESFKICELAYETYGTKDMVVRLNDRTYYDQFVKLGARIVEPSMAIVNLLDQFVRSPSTTSLLLGMEESQTTAEIEVRDPDIHGMFIRDLRLPPDIIILSIKRGEQILVSHGYTRLRKHDLVNIVGSKESLEQVRMRFES
ncbi:cation:proton antiporter [Flammeovirgaceae bacterium SG7u.111]|nr:cation:proton antiporter [Flammeovirgaceae bacterium SG7u.132]WPO33013.1 cation:proton antiporter [Flammeovirgaceae bacterium SG7u.111]